MKTIKRRRKEARTDYLKRLKLLKGGKPRIVFRKTNRYIIAQYIETKEAKDKIRYGITSKILLRYGWPREAEGSLKSISASYLTGFLFGRKIKEMPEPIIDIGMIQNIHKTKIFSFIKGVKDSGVNIKCKEDVFPEDERIKGKDLKNKIPFQEIKSKIELGR